MTEASAESWSRSTISVILLNIAMNGQAVFLNYYLEGEGRKALLRNPGILGGGLMTGAEIKIALHSPPHGETGLPEAELILEDEDFLPDEFCELLDKDPPQMSTFFGLISELTGGEGRYYMLRDINANGLLLCTGHYHVKKGIGRCARIDREWPLKYNLVENFFYAGGHAKSEIKIWKHPSLPMREPSEKITMKDLSKKFRDRAALWHRYNFFYSDDWSLKFYKTQARLGFIAITHTEEGKTSLTPQLQREYALLDWKNLTPGSHVRKIIEGNRIDDENIRLNISADPSAALENLGRMWNPSWIVPEYEKIIKNLATLCRIKKDRNFRIWGVTLTAGEENKVIAGELGYSIGRTYTSLSGFFHRGEKRYSNFGKLQMVMLAEILERSGIAFWNLGQPYMEYKLKLGAEVVPRGLFFKRWDRAVRGRTPDLSC